MSTTQSVADAVYRKIYNKLYEAILDDYRRRLNAEPGTLQEAEAARAAEFTADVVWPEVYRYKRLYDEGVRQINSLYDYVERLGIILPDPGDGFS